MFKQAATVAFLAVNLFLVHGLPTVKVTGLGEKHEEVDNLLDRLQEGRAVDTSTAQTTSSSSQSVSSSSQNVPNINIVFNQLLKDPNFIAQLYAFLLQLQTSSNSQSSTSQVSQAVSSNQALSSNQAVTSSQVVSSTQASSGQGAGDFKGIFSSPSFLNFLTSFFIQSNKETTHAPASSSVQSIVNQGGASHASQVTVTHSTSSSQSNQAVTSNQSQTSQTEGSTNPQINGHSRPIISVIESQDQTISGNNQVASVVGVNQVSNQNQVINQEQVVSTPSQSTENNQASFVIISNQNQENSLNQAASSHNQVNVNKESSVVSVSNQNQEASQSQVVNESQESGNNQATLVVSGSNQNENVDDEVHISVDDQVNSENSVVTTQTSSNQVVESNIVGEQVSSSTNVVPVVVTNFEDRFGEINGNSQSENSATVTQVISGSNAQSSQASNVQEISSSTSAESVISSDDSIEQLAQWFQTSRPAVTVSQGSGEVMGNQVSSVISSQSNHGARGPSVQLPIVSTVVVPPRPQIVLGVENVMGGHANTASVHPVTNANKYVYNEAEEKKMAARAHYQFASKVLNQLEGNYQERAEIREGTRVYGKYSYDDGFQWRTVYYQADENGYRVIKEVVTKSRVTQNPEGVVKVHTLNDGNKVDYQITRKDISHKKPKKPSQYGISSNYAVHV